MIVFAIIGITKIETTGNIVDDIPKNDPISIDLKFFEDNFVGVMPFEIMINTNKNNGITKSSTLKRIQKLEDILSEYPEISSTTSILDLAKFTKQAFYNGNPKFYSLPSSPSVSSRNRCGRLQDTLAADARGTFELNLLRPRVSHRHSQHLCRRATQFHNTLRAARRPTSAQRPNQANPERL